ncbi:hypothetical protein TRICHSKD4_2953 [Roseibium sp. TrichSKD4]|nr:hypothetical protein TRICHSKD4_2953 [Roseibium sp. TrichSKD4]
MRSAQKMLSGQQELRFYATRDPLTKLRNRRCFMEEVGKLQGGIDFWALSRTYRLAANVPPSDIDFAP